MALTRYEHLSALDTSFLEFERSGTPMNVAVVAVLDGEPLIGPGGGLAVERIRDYVDSRLHLLPRYRQRLGFTPIRRQPIWLDDHRFNLHYHLRHACIPRPGGEVELKEFAGQILSQPLDRSRPLWELWLVEGLRDGRFAMLAKAHHCMVDGIAGVEILQALLRPSPDTHTEPPPRWLPQPRPTFAQLLVDESIQGARASLDMLLGLREVVERPTKAWETLVDSATAVRDAAEAGLRRVASTPLNDPIGSNRRIDWRALDLGAVRDLKSRLRGTVNDIVLAIVTGALRRFLRERRVPLEDLNFRFVIPVNMRTEPDAAANRVSAWFLTPPLAEPDPIRRFARIRAATQKLRQSKTAEGIGVFLRLADWTGSTLLTRTGTRLAARLHPYNLIVTNVPGPQFPLYLLGARVRELHPQVPLFENQGLGVAVLSYDGRVCFGIGGDWDLVPDLRHFVDAIQDAFTELTDAAAGTAQPSAPATVAAPASPISSQT
jgi:WS/DGAT/MGAT family acyltransferase